LTKKHIFLIKNDRYILDEDSKTIIEKPKNSIISYSQAKQLNKNTIPVMPIKKTITLRQFLRTISDEKNIEISDLLEKT